MRAAVAAVLACTVALPAVQLAGRWADEGGRPASERPASFQMYSATGRPTYVGLGAQGERVLDADVLPPLLRAVGTGSAVPRRLCARHPDLRAVRREGGADPRTVRC